MNRRSFLASCGAAALTVATGRAWSQAAPAAASAATPAALAAQSYWRAFPTLAPALFSADDLARLANGLPGVPGLSAEPEWLKDDKGEKIRGANGRYVLTATPENEIDDEENFAVPAGYTYLGQFIDHDLTFRIDDNFQQIGGTGTNERTAALDLDCLYGGGPARTPYLYARDGIHLVRGRALTRMGLESSAQDHPRVNGRAVIGDKRNDENVIVSQIHGVFADFHNAVADAMPGADFETVRTAVVRHYQWMIVTDFLPRLCGSDMIQTLVPDFGTKTTNPIKPNLTFARNLPAGALPLEFTDAAYRFGHSIVRPVYRLNLAMRGTSEERKRNPGMAGRKAIFAAAENSGLNGFREYPDEWAIDWPLFFELDAPLTPSRVKDGPARVQAAYKIDTSLANPLAHLPEFAAMDSAGRIKRDSQGFPIGQPGTVPNLALRNLLRAQTSQLPSGQDVARAMGLHPLADRDIRIGKAAAAELGKSPSILAFGDSFKGRAPLWVYVLAEARYDWERRAITQTGDLARNVEPSWLGPVGSRLVAETFLAVLAADPQSLLNTPGWRPVFGQTAPKNNVKAATFNLGQPVKFTMVDLVRFAGHG